jgi:DNA-binding IclR family transcriptional regulator
VDLEQVPYSSGVSAEPSVESPQRQGIQSVEIAMTVLQALERHARPASLTQLAAMSGMQPSKVHRYLVSLCRIGLVSQSRSSGLYDFGPAMRRLGADALRRMDEVGLASEHLPGLRDRTEQAVNLAVWGDHGPVVVRWDYGSYALPITVRVGATLPLLASSVGRVYLAHLPETLTDPIVQTQPITTLTAKEIQRIKDEVLRDGFAVTSGGVVPGVTSVAAPVFTAGESLPLVVALALPAQQATPDVLREITADLLNTTRAMSAEIGYQSSRSARPHSVGRTRRSAG